jgi:hypothetical protein
LSKTLHTSRINMQMTAQAPRLRHLKVSFGLASGKKPGQQGPAPVAAPGRVSPVQRNTRVVVANAAPAAAAAACGVACSAATTAGAALLANVALLSTVTKAGFKPAGLTELLTGSKGGKATAVALNRALSGVRGGVIAALLRGFV